MRIITVLFAALLSAAAQGGTWGTGKWGTMVWGATPQGEDGTPTIETVEVGPGELAFNLSYAGSAEITGFRVVCTNINDNTDLATGDGLTGSSVIVNDLNPGETYDCVASIRNGVGQSDFYTAAGDVQAIPDGFPNNLLLIISAFCQQNPAQCGNG